MTWQSAKHDGESRAALMLEKLRAAQRAGQMVTEVRLSDYADAETYQFLRLGEEWSFEYWQMVNRAVARALRKEGFKVRLVPLHLADYMNWLADESLGDSAESRAQFVGSQS
jgi:hypothetical protein